MHTIINIKTGQMVGRHKSAYRASIMLGKLVAAYGDIFEVCHV